MVTDSRCPECGDPVGKTASYCMHCDAEFDTPVAGGDSEKRAGDDPTDDTETAVSDDTYETTLTTWEQRLSRWLGPDGWIDNSLTIVIAIGVGFLLGPLAAIVLALLTGSLWSIVVGFVVLIGATAFLANQRTVYGTVRGGCFSVSALLVILPVAFITWVSERPLTQLDVFLAFEFSVGLVVVPLVVIGTLAGRLRAKFSG
jgi:hypothetical protein